MQNKYKGATPNEQERETDWGGKGGGKRVGRVEIKG